MWKNRFQITINSFFNAYIYSNSGELKNSWKE
jgi:hypothetical protein